MVVHVLGLALLVAYLVRDVYQMAVVFTTWDRYVVHLFGQISVVILVVLLLILLVATEAYYRHGVPRHQVWVRFARVMGILALVMATAQGFRLALEVIAGSVNLVSVLIFVSALLVYAGAAGVTGRAARATAGPERAQRQRRKTPPGSGCGHESRPRPSSSAGRF